MRTPTVRHVQRWRLEKKNPGAGLSEPVQPITYYIDRTVPIEWRPFVRAGAIRSLPGGGTYREELPPARRKGSKMWGRSVSGIGGPWFVTVRTTAWP